MLRSRRQRAGIHDPEVLANIRAAGGSEIFMMLTSNKCRAAASWLKDVLFSNPDGRPWTLSPTEEPDLSPEEMPALVQRATDEAMEIETMMGMVPLRPDKLHEIAKTIRDRVLAEMREESRDMIKRAESKIADQLQEGKYDLALHQVISDIVDMPAGILKGPVIRKKPKLEWAAKPEGGYEMKVVNALVKEWDRVDPLRYYPAPTASCIDDGYGIEHHTLQRVDLRQLRGVEGYSTEAIDAVLEEHGRGGLREWLSIDSERARAEEKSQSADILSPDKTIDALQFWGHVQGKMLVEWGMAADKVPDLLDEYFCEVWLIGRWVIKAAINSDPFGRKPYYKSSYESIPGKFWGNGVPDLIRDCQLMCNAAAQALDNNMSIASGPQVDVAVDRLPPGENITRMYPWKIWQTTSDVMGSTAPAVRFFQPQSNAAELMAIYEKFSVLADEYSSVPRYMTGDAPAGGAGRTASGMNMLMNNAGKSMKAVVGNVDIDIIGPAIDRQYYYNLRYGNDPDIRGDLRVVARGARLLMAKEQAQQRRNEFLNIVLASPVVSGIIGEEAVVRLLRSVADGLDFPDLDKIIPAPEIVRARLMQQTAAMQAQQGAQVMPDNKQQLENGAPVTDTFAPARQG